MEKNIKRSNNYEVLVEISPWFKGHSRNMVNVVINTKYCLQLQLFERNQ